MVKLASRSCTGTIILDILLLFTDKLKNMPDPKTDNQGFASENADQERDKAPKGGPATGLGNPDNRHAAPKPYSDDLQTQIAAKGNKKQENEEEDGKA